MSDGATNTPNNNVTGRDRVIFDLALEAAQDGNLQMADYLTDKAIEAEQSGGTTSFHLPGFDSMYGKVRSLDTPFWKSAARNSVKSQPTPHRYNENLDLLGFYDGLKSFEDVTGHTLAFLEACTRNPVVAMIIRRRVYQATRFRQVFNPITNDNMEPGSPGFRVKLRQSSLPVSSAARRKINDIQEIILHGGVYRERDGSLRRHSITDEPGVWDGHEEEKARPFEEMLAVLVRQSLGMDFAPLRSEAGVDERAYPVTFFAPVDATRIRRTVAGVYKPQIDKSLKSVAFVEISARGDGRAVREYDWAKMDTLIRFPRVDFWGRGYGYSEIEDLFDILTVSALDLKHKRSYLDDNYIPAMLVTMQGQPLNMSQQTIELFRSQIQNQSGTSGWNKMIFLPFPSGSQNAIQTFPLRQMTGGTGEMQAMQSVNVEMTTAICSMYGMHPEEIGYQGVTTMRQTLSEADPKSQIEYAQETGFIPLMEKIEAFIDRFVVEKIDPDFEFEFTNLNPRQTNDIQHVQMLLQQGLTPNRINEMRDMPTELVPLEPTLYRKATKKLSKFDFETDEDFKDAVEVRYQKMCKKRGLTPYSDYNDMPIGNPEAMQIIMQEKQQNEQIKQQAEGGGMPGMPPGMDGLPPDQQQAMMEQMQQEQGGQDGQPQDLQQYMAAMGAGQQQGVSPQQALAMGNNAGGVDSIGNGGMQKSVNTISRDGKRYRVVIEEVSNA